MSAILNRLTRWVKNQRPAVVQKKRSFLPWSDCDLIHLSGKTGVAMREGRDLGIDLENCVLLRFGRVGQESLGAPVTQIQARDRWLSAASGRTDSLHRLSPLEAVITKFRREARIKVYLSSDLELIKAEASASL